MRESLPNWEKENIQLIFIPGEKKKIETRNSQKTVHPNLTSNIRKIYILKLYKQMVDYQEIINSIDFVRTNNINPAYFTFLVWQLA